MDRDGDVLQSIIGRGRAEGADLVPFGDTTLKRVPKPYDQHHPHGALLRRKQIALGAAIGEDGLRAGLMPAIRSRIVTFMPFWQWCRASTA